MATLKAGLAFFSPAADVLEVPAWDCLPYDRVSPNGEVISRRVESLSILASGTRRPDVVLTTVNALLQKVSPKSYFADSVLAVSLNAPRPIDDIVAFLNGNGYGRAATVREPGEYAVRGGILDVFPTGSEEPVRLDFFGDDIEEIRAFDPATQRSTEKRKSVVFRPVGEITLDETSVQRFRTGYRKNFGVDVSNDPLYEAVSAGRRHGGMEHWLPLFHDRLETLFDYLDDPSVFLDHQAEAAIQSRLELIREYYDARASMMRSGGTDGAPYRPLEPEALYLTSETWTEAIGQRRIATLTAFDAPDVGDIVPGGGRIGLSFAEARSRPDVNIFDAAKDALDRERGLGRRVLVTGFSRGSRDRLLTLLSEHDLTGLTSIDTWEAFLGLEGAEIGVGILPIDHGFRSADVLVVTETDILGERLARPQRRRRRGEEFLQEISALSEDDFVVHVEHGIGQYSGLETLEIGGAPHDCLRLLYAGGDKLFVPVESIDVLSRYGSSETNAVLDKLGGAGWQARRARVKKRLRDMADQLIAVAAQRELNKSDPIEPPAGIYQEFAAKFPYTETDDQARAIDETLGDLARGRPMDRLVCGDVGFGKTEVALRAAMVVAMQGRQVAIVVPTTLLARQHFRVFQERFQDLPLKVRQLSRLVAGKEATATKSELAHGDCDIVVGTHALLAKSINFKDLGLVIVDEEQHFGVAQKERLKELRTEVHVLTLTATPIPRTLQLALTGVREMSLIATPPVDRLAVRTFVLPYDGMVIREAIMREHFRGGQTFYVCPRIEDLPRVYDRLAQLVPEAKIGTAHGQMPAKELEDVMTRFTDGAFDILLSTNIVESGLDIPTANTIVIHRADMFGLAQLYQLRGRVGRSKTRAYAYLTTHPSKPLNSVAKRRLEVMQTLDSLGAGFSLASHDMDIRGAGNLLGDEQSGHVREVGIELYQQLLQEAVAAAREGGFEATAPEDEWTPQIALGTPILIPEVYVPDLSVRLGLYRRIAILVDQQEIDGFAAELADRFGPVPPEVENLLRVIAIKRLCKKAGVEKVDAGPKGAVISFRNNMFADPAKLVGYISERVDSITLRPDHKLVCRRPWGKPEKRVRGVTKIMRDLAKLAA